MSLNRDRRRLDAGAVGVGVLGVLLPGEIAVGPAVEFAVFENVDVLGRQVVAQVVAVVVVRPQLAGRGVERQADGIAQPLGEQMLARAVGVVPHDRRAPRV